MVHRLQRKGFTVRATFGICMLCNAAQLPISQALRTSSLEPEVFSNIGEGFDLITCFNVRISSFLSDLSCCVFPVSLSPSPSPPSCLHVFFYSVRSVR